MGIGMVSGDRVDVIAVGHALVDIRIVVREFPPPDQESPVLEQNWGAGGSAVNVAIGVRRLGMLSAIVAKIGFDSFGRIVVDELLREGVDMRGLRISWGRTGFTIVGIDSSGEVIMYSFKGSAEDLEPQEVDEDLVRRARHVHIASLRIDTSARALEIAKKHGLTTSWDPGRLLSKKGIESLRGILSMVDIAMLSNGEAYNMTGEKIYTKAAEIIRNTGPETVIIKLGREGVYISSKEYTGNIPAFDVAEVIDTTGAGDAFAAGYISSMLRGYSVKKAAVYASAVAAMKVTKLGSHETPSHDEVIRFIWDRIPSF